LDRVLVGAAWLRCVQPNADRHNSVGDVPLVDVVA